MPTRVTVVFKIELARHVVANLGIPQFGKTFVAFVLSVALKLSPHSAVHLWVLHHKGGYICAYTLT